MVPYTTRFLSWAAITVNDVPGEMSSESWLRSKGVLQGKVLTAPMTGQVDAGTRVGDQP